MCILEFLGGILFLDGVGAGRGTLLVELSAHRAVELLFEDGLGLDGLKLGLEVAGGIRAGVASTTGIGYVVAHVLNLITGLAPVERDWVSIEAITMRGWFDVMWGSGRRRRAVVVFGP